MSSEQHDVLGSEESDDTRATSNRNLTSGSYHEDESTDEELDSLKPYGDIQPLEKDDDESTIDPTERKQQRDARKKARQRATKRASQEFPSLGEELDVDNLHEKTPIASQSDMDFEESISTGDMIPIPPRLHSALVPALMDESAEVVPHDQTTYPEDFGGLVPMKSRAMIPIESEALDPVGSQALAPFETGALVTVDPGIMMPVQPGALVPVEPRTLIPVQPGALVSTKHEAIMTMEPEGLTSSQDGSIIPLQPGTMVSNEFGAIVPVDDGQSSTLAFSEPVGSGTVVPVEARSMVATETEANIPDETGAMVLYQPDAIVDVEAEGENVASDDIGAMVPFRSGSHLGFETSIQISSENKGFPVTSTGTLVPMERRIEANVTSHMDEGALVVHESRLVSMDADQGSVHSKESKESNKTAITNWSGYEEKSVSSGSQFVREKPRHYDDDVSLTTEDVFGISRPITRISTASPIPEDKTVESSTASGHKNRSKAYSDDVSTVVEEEIIEDHYDDASTINTFGSSYWNSLEKPAAAAQSQIIPETIYEEDDEDEESQRESSIRSMQSSLKKPAKQLENASLNSSWRSASVQSTASTSARSSSRGSTRGSTSDGMRMVQRPGAGRATRRDQSREVEVSLDGFLHQKRTVSGGGANLMHQPLLTVNTGEKPSKLSRMYQITTLCSLMCLLTTVLFFAAHIGPFVIQPQEKGTPAASSATPGVSTESAGLIADPSLQGDSSAFLITPNSTENSDSNKIPLWMARSFLGWKMPHKGGASEVPFFWNHEKSGGDIVIESLGRCLSKVVAGQGKAYDDNRHPADFESDNFKVMISPTGLRYLNVDLFSLDGLDRAGSMGVTQNRVADMLDTPFLKLAAEKLFAPKSGEAYPAVLGRLFVMFRDPMDRALNRYEMTRILAGDDSLSLSAFATNPIYSENNPMARELLGIGPQDALGSKEIAMVYEIINQLVVVGLFHDLESTIKRFEEFTLWSIQGAGGDNNNSGDELAICRQEVWSNLEGSYRISTDYATKDPVGFNLLAAGHTMDLVIFQYAKTLFIEQGKALGRIGSNTA